MYGAWRSDKSWHVYQTKCKSSFVLWREKCSHVFAHVRGQHVAIIVWKRRSLELLLRITVHWLVPSATPIPQTLHLIANREIRTLKAFEEIFPRPFSPAGSPTPLHRLRFLFQDVLTMSYTPFVCVSFSTKINYTWGNHLRGTESVSGIAYCCEDVCSRNMENSPFSVELSISHALLRIVEWIPSNFGV